MKIGNERANNDAVTVKIVMDTAPRLDCSQPLYNIYARERKSERSECEARGGGGGVCERSEQEE